MQRQDVITIYRSSCSYCILFLRTRVIQITRLQRLACMSLRYIVVVVVVVVVVSRRNLHRYCYLRRLL
ncbi:hypothetical protein F4680DRAFT_440918 [Xylaria scruposa]|nr:hypothetical protein F4680DRAFT_440918 [Xylaria scruposa]